VIETLALLVPVLIAVAYLTYAERQGDGGDPVAQRTQCGRLVRLLQPFADAIKMDHEGNIIPSGANRLLFIMAPMLTFVLSHAGMGGHSGE